MASICIDILPSPKWMCCIYLKNYFEQSINLPKNRKYTAKSSFPPSHWRVNFKPDVPSTQVFSVHYLWARICSYERWRKHQDQATNINTSLRAGPQNPFKFPSCPPSALYSKTTYCFLLCLFSVSLEHFPSPSLTLSKTIGHLFRRMTLSLGLSDVASWLDLAFAPFGKAFVFNAQNVLFNTK